MIIPTVGRVVWFFEREPSRSEERGKPLAAIVSHVHSDRMVNLTVLDPNGLPFSRTSVDLIQQEDEAGAARGLSMWCEWMPYQVGQAKKHEPKKLHESTFGYLKPTEEQNATMAGIREASRQYAALLDDRLPDGPDKDYILRRVRETAMWVNVAITREADGAPRP